ncbi:GNAT family N-acetyltransferase [Brevibacillus humidisoli]|uniref:GNAT family N-acetyltransferase n=1 Tax=Brevibacillus humidisoli TaxID=2895522 RepID=UPI001E2F5369|nr:GNAT family N-acetyltransferase [Brevibacillus humidisoli]
MQVVSLQQRPDLFEAVVEVFWRQWGTQDNYRFYHDCMLHSGHLGSDLPTFYVAVHGDSIVGIYALLRTDFVSRQDLFPWLACLYIVPEHRGNKYGSLLLKHAAEEAFKKGYDNVYLYSDLEGYYEKYGWSFLANGYTIGGHATKIYVRASESTGDDH